MKSFVDGSEFKDPSGKTPKAYIQVMKKLNLTREEVEEEARKLKIVIDPVHFEEVVSKKRSGRPQKAEKAEKPDPKPKGRPKSSNTKALELNGEEEDIFAKLVSNANANDNDDMSDLTVSVSDKTEVLPAKNSLTSVCKMAMNVVAVEESKVEVSNEAEEAKKASKKAASELEKAAKKEAAEAEKAAKKAAVELEKAAKKEAAELEKAAKKAAAELEKAAKKEAAEAEKAAKKAAAEIEKAAKKPLELGLKTVEEEVAVADVVTKLKIGNVLYYKSKNTGVIYDTEQEVVGMWNSSKNCIDFNKDNESDEVDEEGYESENN
jgi:hypothetical protein